MGFASLTAALEKQTSKASCIKAGWEVHPVGENLLYPSTAKASRTACFWRSFVLYTYPHHRMHRCTKPSRVCRIAKRITGYLPSYWRLLLGDLFHLDPQTKHSVSLEYGLYLERYYLWQEENRISFAMALWDWWIWGTSKSLEQHYHLHIFLSCNMRKEINLNVSNTAIYEVVFFFFYMIGYCNTVTLQNFGMTILTMLHLRLLKWVMGYGRIQ